MARILVVEDDAMVIDALRILFESAGHEVLAAGAARQAVERCVEDRPDVMLLDLTLPDGDGLMALREATERGAAPPVTAALTGHDDPVVVERCLRAGCREVLVKPVPIAVLVAKVREWTASEP
jgi:CheY-like chemotaxis protein